VAFANRRSSRRNTSTLATFALTAFATVLFAVAGPPRALAETRCTITAICTTFSGKLTPKALPRHKPAPVRLRLDGGVRVASTSSAALPQLNRITMAINRHGRLRLAGLPTCRGSQVRDAPSSKALAACKSALVGTGRFEARLELPDQPTLIFDGKALIFNARIRGKPGLLAHVFAREPTNLAIVVPFVIHRPKRHKGTYGTFLRSPSLPRLLGDEIYATSFAFNLGRIYRVRGRRYSYLNASCPAPKGFPSAVFNFARAVYYFKGGRRAAETLTRVCRVRG
jgi:hypothetical protein